ncbi:hypothetical protein HYT26_04950 [Candidatus Pacearchaeota archaeon]|nr:hypothetical protein [Candidatus Pacearchaeota archaeon]
MEKIKYVTLRCAGEKEQDYVCNTLQKAIGSLGSLGICNGWAMLTKLNDFTILLYEGWTYADSRRLVKLPFKPSASNFASCFEALLKNTFAPFQKDTNVYRSFIQVKQHTNVKMWYSVSLCLMLGRCSHDQAFLELDKISSGRSETAKSTAFKCD